MRWDPIPDNERRWIPSAPPGRTGSLQSTLDAIDQVAVHQCGHCQEPLAEDSTSLDFCSNVCQTAWTRNKHEIVALLDYEEPTDLPQHVSNLVELSSPETTPRRGILDRLFCDCPICSDLEVRLTTASRPAQVYVSTNPGADSNDQTQWQLFGTAGPGALVVRVEPDIERYREAWSRLALSMGAAYGIPAFLLGWEPPQQETPSEDRFRELQRLMITQDEARRFGLLVDDERPETPQERALRLRRTRNTGPQLRPRAPRQIDARRAR